MTNAQLSVAFFLQMFFILAVCRVVGLMARRLGQPQVVGEMIAGVFMGPSLFGFFFHDLQQQLFPPESLKVLYVGAQLGVGIYMFLVGVEFNTATFLSRARSAASVSIAGMIAPFVFGAGLAILLIKVRRRLRPVFELRCAIEAIQIIHPRRRPERDRNRICKRIATNPRRQHRVQIRQNALQTIHVADSRF